jgi:hypothetical protein
MPIDPLQAHRDAISDLSRRQAAGDLTREQFLEESEPHARVLVALEADAERDATIKLVRQALANPAIVEAVAIGAAHYVRAMAAGQVT